jgi:hypothetical protein
VCLVGFEPTTADQAEFIAQHLNRYDKQSLTGM